MKIRKKAKKNGPPPRPPAAPPILPNSGRDFKSPKIESLKIDTLYAKVAALRIVDDDDMDAPPKTEP